MEIYAYPGKNPQGTRSHKNIMSDLRGLNDRMKEGQ